MSKIKTGNVSISFIAFTLITSSVVLAKMGRCTNDYIFAGVLLLAGLGTLIYLSIFNLKFTKKNVMAISNNVESLENHYLFSLMHSFIHTDIKSMEIENPTKKSIATMFLLIKYVIFKEAFECYVKMFEEDEHIFGPITIKGMISKSISLYNDISRFYRIPEKIITDSDKFYNKTIKTVNRAIDQTCANPLFKTKRDKLNAIFGMFAYAFTNTINECQNAINELNDEDIELLINENHFKPIPAEKVIEYTTEQVRKKIEADKEKIKEGELL